ncbi:energy-coupling factor transporter transmembrane component T family protein [Anaerobacillus sp. MEB173]|uniref:energy-coupling factor transporter transmembrane component T family protein n=1 Tax=Anaerobacillus sp. MEB173 TaxID=3383345 RepID=UPI003F8EBAAC
MFKNIIIGQYIQGSSLIHRFDARSKLIGVFIFVLVVFLANNWTAYSILGAVTIMTVLISQVPLRFIYKGLRPVFIIILITFLLHLFMTKDGHLLLEIGWFEIYSGGVIQGAFIAMRLLFLIMMTSLLTLTTTPIDLTDGLESLLSPFKRFGLPAHELALMMSISLRFIPTLLQETEKIIKAQMARGADFGSGSLKDRARALVPLLIPLFINAFKRAEDLALAMEARGYRGGEGRTKLRELQWSHKDSLMLVSLLLLAILLFFLRS